jgi:uncharacterized protein (DUF58 family)
MLAKLDRLSLSIGDDLISGLMGEHVAARRTTGIEFADYRQYNAGDDLRRVDWNAYARLGTLHVRQAQAEHDTVLYLLLDGSASMDFGRPNKWRAARRLAASLGYIALANLDALVLAAPGSIGGDVSPSAFRGRAESARLFRQLQDMRTAPGEATDLGGAMAGWASVRGQGKVMVVISDLLMDGYREGVRVMSAAGYGVTLLQILAPDELRPPDSGDLELEDSETGRRLEVHLGREGRAEYSRRLKAWLQETEDWCRSTGAGYVLVESEWDTERILLEILRRHGVTA